MYHFMAQRVDSLERGACLMVWSARMWVASMAQQRCPASAVAPAFAKMQMLGGLQAFQTVMLSLNVHALQPFAVGPLKCRHLTDDEALLLAMLAACEQPATARRLPETLALVIEEERIAAMLTALEALSLRLAAAGLAVSGPPNFAGQTG